VYLIKSRLNDFGRSGIVSFLSLVFLVAFLFSTISSVFFFMLRFLLQLQFNW
jgi:uncharacterized membrane protein YhaH (DUF805 family)